MYPHHCSYREQPLGPDPREDMRPERDDDDDQYERMRDARDERRENENQETKP